MGRYVCPLRYAAFISTLLIPAHMRGGMSFGSSMLSHILSHILNVNPSIADSTNGFALTAETVASPNARYALTERLGETPNF